MVELELSHDAPLDDWTINGSPDGCVEAIARASAMGLERIPSTACRARSMRGSSTCR
jgi:hypothetical protein